MKRALVLLVLTGCHDWEEGYTRCVREGRCGAGGGSSATGGGGGSSSTGGGGGASSTGGGAGTGGGTAGAGGGTATAGGAGGSGGGASGGSGGAGGGVPGPSVALSWGLAELDAGTLEPGQTVSIPLTLTNLGDLRSSVPTFQVADDAGVFMFANNMCGTGVDPNGGFCNVTLRFSPMTPGSFQGAFTARETMSGSIATLPLVGVGRLADLPVTVRRTGTGAGSIDFVSPPMAPCTADAGCTYLVSRGTTVQLTALPSESDVGGWSGDCTGSTASCSFTVTADAGATATVQLNLWPQVTVRVSPPGLPGARVVSLDGGLDCPGDCTQRFPPMASVTLRTAPTAPTTRPVSLSSQPSSSLCSSADAGSCTFVMPSSNVFVDAGFIGTNYIFPTSVELPANLTRAQYDQTCANLAADAGLFGGSWAAVLGTQGNSIPVVFAGRSGYMRPDGKPVANVVEPTLARIFYPPRIDERGRDVWLADGGTTLVMTGSGITGCFNWDLMGTSGAVASGSATAGERAWFSGAGSVPCAGGVARIYCAQYLWSTTVSVPTPPPSSRFAFLSQQASRGDLDADQVCRTEALSAGYDAGVYVALRATMAAPALARVRLDAGTWVRPDGVLLAETANDFAVGKLAAPLAIGTNGNSAATTDRVWTGSTAIGAPALDILSNCSDWMGSSSGYTGLPLESGLPWFSQGNAVNCVLNYRFYCMQQ